jgi:hypothetical protein
MKYYELQRFVGGGWETYSVFDEQMLAIDAGKGLMNSGRPPAAVRVVEEDEKGGAPRTVFRESTVDGHNKEVVQRQLDTTREVEVSRAVRQSETALVQGAAAAAAQKRKPINWWIVYLRLSIVLTAAWFFMVLFRRY